ncbi:sigma-70 family RNA polymerase sigma factor [Streptomyces sp. LX-29]|uniref:BACON domain-containing protein n=1 Tax=Streptomyces sp. LX-29 TaxID=2900152 RepID=UPI00240D43BD|nr:sigma-70 family RNA polymerase sigma factor [Streptomyces sp. LX-29]WFB08114.1 sigma-70 family RNA polymerase sigma factor [Streptomyces sp. LX-29]
MSRTPEQSTQVTGAHRAQNRPPRAASARPSHPPTRYEPYLDGLFTYCLSVLCDHDAATTALGEALAVAERRRERGRPGRGRSAGRGARAARDDRAGPAVRTDALAGSELHRSWLYALARWSCLRVLADLRAAPPSADGAPGGTTSAAWIGSYGAYGSYGAFGACASDAAALGARQGRRPADDAPAGPGGVPRGVGMTSRPAASDAVDCAPDSITSDSASDSVTDSITEPFATGLHPPFAGERARAGGAGATASGALWTPREAVPMPCEADPTSLREPGASPRETGVPPRHDLAERRGRELATLAWPEAAGTTAEQREALELAVRHQLSPQEVAAVLGREPDDTRTLLSSAACEVERTRAALAVVELGQCPVVARLAGDSQVLLSAALRRELVRHVDDCRTCRHRAERATARGPWPGTAAAPAALPVMEAPRAAVHAAMLGAQRTRPARAGAWPRFDRLGFPLDPKDRGARRSRLRSRAVTTTIVATVIAAPVLALWAAYREAPMTGADRDPESISAHDGDAFAGEGLDGPYDPYENAGSARDGEGQRLRASRRDSDVSVEVISVNGRRYAFDQDAEAGPDGGPDHGDGSEPGGRTPAPPRAPGSEGVPTPGGPDGGPGPSEPDRPIPGPGRLTVDAQPSGDTTLITLTASGGSAVRWSASANAPWLRLSQSAGELRPGESTTITVSVDHAHEPVGPWSARISVAPAGAVVVIEGRGTAPEPEPEPTPVPGTPDPTPTPTPGTPSTGDPGEPVSASG